MAFRQLAVIGVTSFLLGLLFTHWIADSLTLWKVPITDEHLWTAASYYHILLKGPAWFAYAASAAVALGAATILWSLRDGQAGNLMFDGASIFLFGTSIVVYTYSVIPTLLAHFPTLPTHAPGAPFPPALKPPTLELASSHLVCSVALTGVLALQAGRWWAERADADDEREIAEVAAPPESVSADDAARKRRRRTAKKDAAKR